MTSTSPASASEQYVLFELVNTAYAVRSSAVSRLEMVENVTPVPNATESLEGVVLSRGRIIPAVNLRTRFGFSRIAYDLRTRLLVVEANGRMVGLIVDAAREFTTLAGSEIKPPPEAIANLNGDYLEGIANINGRVILVLKLEELLKIADEAPANEATN
ncbi:MAG TPA: chemotaxis protein CheW [Pyrinomonadaceae bacterium]|jgi:purine-binding chemotaxis protein CheW